MEFTSLKLHEAAGLLKTRQISPVELTSAHLDRIARLDKRLNCFITLTHELALQQAHQAESSIQHGEYKGALHGIPVGLKDLYETQGIRTTAGSTLFWGHIPE